MWTQVISFRVVGLLQFWTDGKKRFWTEFLHDYHFGSWVTVLATNGTRANRQTFPFFIVQTEAVGLGSAESVET